ncbi:PREDICTED: DNA ligase 6 isoform X2 [Tarenaya hassleriana]|uniref:DNA ligase 6 isoform X2 n=1 Tax=Tarenaya hassleriana TaxID=28532 RepID=UPI00053C73E4|nr:PREDICTED: DNA ligase 6 isoform X2 [Tarenaya hassleriana]
MASESSTTIPFAGISGTPATSGESPSGENTVTLTLNSSELFLSAVSSVSPPIQTSKPRFPSPLVPASKRIPKTTFVVDFFRFPPSSDSSTTAAFFLSHFHSDHYSGLSASWSQGIIFCSDTTARLVRDVLQVPSQFVFALPLQQTVVIDGCDVILIDANHCPGAVQFLFKLKLENGGFERYVHTGDFRFCESMKLDPFLCEFVGCDGIFLDTTYCNKKFVFPTQEESVDYVASVVDKIGGEFVEGKKRVLFLVATYVVGKEKILVEIARRCKRKIFVDTRKMSILRVLGFGEIGIFTEDENESDVHVVGWSVLGETWPYFRPNFARMKEIMNEKGYDKVVGFVPTGWTYEVKRNKFAVRSKDSMEIHLVPYSEHSNYEELREYVKFLKPKRVVPTVGIDIEKLDSKQVSKMQKHFSGLVDEMANKKEFLMGFYRGSCQKNEKIEIDVGLSLNRKHGKDEKADIACENNVPCGISNALLSSGEPLLQGSVTGIHSSDTEKLLIELRDCLPAWVSGEQMLDLISRSENNAVEIINSFYELETELYKQASLSASNSQGQAIVFDDSVPLSQKCYVDSTPPEVYTSQKGFEVPSNVVLMKSTISPGKRKKNIGSKLNKKAKKDPKLEPLGPRQSTITKFFNKVLDNGPDFVGQPSETEECTTVGNKVLNDASRGYKETVDQFINIVNGSESLRDYAASIIEKAKGDINRALDIYYSNPKEILGDVCRGGMSSNLIQFMHVPQDCPSHEDKKASEKPGQTIKLSEETSLEANTESDYVSLPPEKYEPVEHACWRDGQPAPYIHLVRTFTLVEGERGKIKAMSMLCNMFRSLLALSPEDVLPAVYLCTNKIAADHENIDLNIGGSLITSALEEACGTSRSTMREMYNSLGDLGDVAQLCRQTQKLLIPPPPLLVRDVFSTLRKISAQTGTGSTRQKKNLIVKLMRSCREKEIKFLVRTLVRNLRIGAMLRTVLPALAQAIIMNSFRVLHNGEISDNCFREKIEVLSGAVVEAYNILPSLDVVVPSLMEKGIEFSSSTLSMLPGIPIKPMLAKISNGVQECVKLFQDKAFTCEYKYDGQRAQIHKLLDGTVRIFSRNGDETTSRFPDLIDIIKQFSSPAAETFMLDAEVVATDRKNGNKLMSFQELSTRERGGKDSLVTLDRIKVDICVFVFDIMFINGEQLLAIPLHERRERLKEVFPETRPGYLDYAKEITVEAEVASLNNEDTLGRISAFLEESFQSSCEGIMVKSLHSDSGYFPSKRSDSWLKVKRDYVEGLNDTLDLVPIGAWHGNGRKAGWYSPFLMACFDPETEEFQSVCRVMSGFSDAFYIEMKEFYSGDKILAKKPPYYRTAETPDMWFSPELVWEIRGADFTVSPVHHAAIGIVHPSRGISIRFPRFIRKVTDRNPEECITSADIAEMFHSQTRKMNIAASHH